MVGVAAANKWALDLLRVASLGATAGGSASSFSGDGGRFGGGLLPADFIPVPRRPGGVVSGAVGRIWVFHRSFFCLSSDPAHGRRIDGGSSVAATPELRMEVSWRLFVHRFIFRRSSADDSCFSKPLGCFLFLGVWCPGCFCLAGVAGGRNQSQPLGLFSFVAVVLASLLWQRMPVFVRSSVRLYL